MVQVLVTDAGNGPKELLAGDKQENTFLNKDHVVEGERDNQSPSEVNYSRLFHF